MGAQQQKRLCPASMSSHEHPAMQCIGGLNRKQLQKLTDPYTGDVNSGRDAAPNAQSVAQHTKAHAHAASAANGVVPPLSQPSKQGHTCMGTPAPSNFLSPTLLPLYPSALAPPAWYPPCPVPGAQLAMPLAHFTWYPVSAPVPYPPGVYTQNPYTSYWPGISDPQPHP